jgi:hypothetical protein
MVTPGPSLDRLILKDVCRFLTLQRPRLKAKASGLSIVMELKTRLIYERLIIIGF